MIGKKYKVLFADDEYWTREKMKTIIEWDTYQLEFLEPAVDGEDVLKKMEVECPDILITDINMPKINGLDLLKKIKDKYPDVVTFVISGYDYFHYVKTALKTGAVNYLLKPVTKVDLINTLSEALEIISERQEDLLERKAQQAELMRLSSLIQDRELSMMIDKEKFVEASNIIINIDMEITGYSLILIKIHNMKEIEKEYNYDMNSISYSIKKMIRENFRKEGLMVFNNIFKANEFIIISEIEGSDIKKRLGLYISKLEEALYSPISIIISEHFQSLNNIHAAYLQAVSLLMTRPYLQKNTLIFKGDCNKIKQSTESANNWNEEFEKRFKILIKSKNQSGIKQLVKDALITNGKYRLTYFEVLQRVKKITALIIDTVVGKKTHSEIIELEDIADFADQTVEYLNIDTLYNILEEFIDIALGDMIDNQCGSIHTVVKEIVEYIDKNYSTELTLTNLAKQFGVESTYLSRVFREDTGGNLIQYIAKRRISAAKSYIAENKFTLTEIAFLSGYEDYSYFSRVFKKVVGKSPSEYKAERLNE